MEMGGGIDFVKFKKNSIYFIYFRASNPIDMGIFYFKRKQDESITIKSKHIKCQDSLAQAGKKPDGFPVGREPDHRLSCYARRYGVCQVG